MELWRAILHFRYGRRVRTFRTCEADAALDRGKLEKLQEAPALSGQFRSYEWHLLWLSSLLPVT